MELPLRQRMHEKWEWLRALPHFRMNAAIYGAFAILGRVRKVDATRGVLPDPIDFFNHNGNILSSMTAAMITTGVYAIHEKRCTDAPLQESLFVARCIGIAASTGLLANALVETKTGVSLPFVQEVYGWIGGNRTDAIDLAYGVAGALGGGVMVLSMSEKTIHQEEIRQDNTEEA